MLTLDRIQIHAPCDRVFAVACDVQRWPEILPHYRWVQFRERRPGGDGGLVEMAAWRPFGPLKYPTWWISEMTVDAEVREIRYRHVRGITTGMDVVWRVRPAEGPEPRAADVEVEHRWEGPAWPVIGGLAANLVIGPVFVHGIASRTLAGIRRHLERGP